MAWRPTVNPYKSPDIVDLNPAAVARGAVGLCDSANGPGAIVAPGDLTSYFAPGKVALWQTPIRNVLRLETQTENFHYVRRDLYSILRCPDLRSDIVR